MKTKNRNPLRIDPTRTLMLRKRFVNDLKRRFAKLKLALVKLIVQEDAFGLVERKPYTFNQFCATGDGGGVDPSCSPSQSSGGGFISRIGAKFNAIADKIPGVKQLKNGVKAAMAAVHKKLEQRYGARTATIIMTSGALGGYAVAGVSFALTGVPGIPFVNDLVSIAAHTAIAEIGLQFKQILGNEAIDDEALAYARELIREELARLVREHQGLGKLAGDARLRELTANVFCATGEGGGVDPTCSLEGHSQVLTSDEVAEKTNDAEKMFISSDSFKLVNVPVSLAKPQPGWSPTGQSVTKAPIIIDVSKLSGEVEVLDGNHRLAEARLRGDTHIIAYVGDRVKLNSGVTNERSSSRMLYDVQQLQVRVDVWSESYLQRQEQSSANAGQVFPTSIDSRVGQAGTGRVQAIPTTNDRWRFRSNPEKIKEFRAWLSRQATGIVGIEEDDLWHKYIEEGFRKGAGRAFDDVRRPRDARSIRRAESGAERLSFYEGTRDEFLRSAFARPIAIEKVKLMAGRTFSDLKGVTDAMSTAMTRTLTDGLVQGKGPREVARDLMRNVDGIGRNRALTIARTETIRAHASGQLEAMERLGVEEVSVMVEWSTAGDDRVCELCEPLEGVVLKLDEAQGMIPRHPNCRCAWIPANVGEDTSEQKKNQDSIESAIRASSRRTDDEDEEGGAWGPGASITAERPQSIFNQELYEFSRLVHAHAHTPSEEAQDALDDMEDDAEPDE